MAISIETVFEGVLAVGRMFGIDVEVNVQRTLDGRWSVGLRACDDRDGKGIPEALRGPVVGGTLQEATDGLGAVINRWTADIFAKTRGSR